MYFIVLHEGCCLNDPSRPTLERQLEQVARASGRSKSDVARDALRRQLALARFETVRRRTLPFAEVGELRRVLRTKFKLPPARIDELEAFPREHEVVPKPAHVLEIEVREPADG